MRLQHVAQLGRVKKTKGGVRVAKSTQSVQKKCLPCAWMFHSFTRRGPMTPVLEIKRPNPIVLVYHSANVFGIFRQSIYSMQVHTPVSVLHACISIQYAHTFRLYKYPVHFFHTWVAIVCDSEAQMPRTHVVRDRFEPWDQV